MSNQFTANAVGSLSPKIELLVVQSTPFCNIDCSYCYLPNRNAKSKMEPVVIERVFERVFRSGWVHDALTVVWHAGEPLVLPPDYYETAFRLANLHRPGNVKLIQSFQTNGTLLNQRWIDFIKRHDVKVGVSLDGPQRLHDRCRRTRQGRGTFAKTMEGVRLLQSNHISFNVISVLGRESLAVPDELFNFYVENDIQSVSFNVEEIEGANTTSSLSGSDATELYRSFMARFWHLALSTKRIRVVREIEDTFSRVIRPAGTSITNTQVDPFSIVSVDHLGNFTTFSPEFLGLKNDQYDDFIFGNLLQVPLESALSRSNFVKLHNDIQRGVDLCRMSCQYFSACGGGAPVNKLAENGSVATTETMSCRMINQVLTDLVISIVESQPANDAQSSGDTSVCGPVHRAA